MKEFMKTRWLFFVLFFPLNLISHAQDFALVENERLSLTGYMDGLRNVWFSEDNASLYADYKHFLKWNIQSGKIVEQVKIPGYSTQSSCLSPNRELWVQANTNYSGHKNDMTNMHANINVYDLSNEEIRSAKTEPHQIRDQEFIPGKQNELLVITSDKTTYITHLKLFSLNTFSFSTELAVSASTKDIMACLAVNEDGRYAAIGYAGADPKIEVYDLLEKQLIKSFNVNKEVSKIEISNGTIVGSGGGFIHLINLATLKLEKSIQTVAGTFALALSPNGKTAAVGDRNNGADLIDLETGTVNHFYTGQCQSLAFDNKGNMLAIGVFKTLHTPEIPSAFIYFNKNKHKDDTSENSANDKVTKWKPYTNETPLFTILLPANPEVTEKKSSKDLKQIRIKSLAKVDGALINVSETRNIKKKNYKKTAQSASEIFLSKMGEIEKVSSKEFNYGESKGIETVFIKGGFRYYYRSIMVNGYLFQLAYFHSKSVSTEHEKFFDSFELKI